MATSAADVHVNLVHGQQPWQPSPGSPQGQAYAQQPWQPSPGSPQGYGQQSWQPMASAGSNPYGQQPWQSAAAPAPGPVAMSGSASRNMVELTCANCRCKVMMKVKSQYTEEGRKRVRNWTIATILTLGITGNCCMYQISTDANRERVAQCPRCRNKVNAMAAQVQAHEEAQQLKQQQQAMYQGAPPLPAGFEYHVFISYRRVGGSDRAYLVRDRLNKIGYRVFLDVSDSGLEQGTFDHQILSRLRASVCVVAIFSPGALDRCKVGVAGADGDWVRKELAEACSTYKVVVPVVDPKFEWPKEGELPPDLANLTRHNAVTWQHDYVDSTMEKLTKFVAGAMKLSAGHVYMQPAPALYASTSNAGLTMGPGMAPPPMAMAGPPSPLAGAPSGGPPLGMAPSGRGPPMGAAPIPASAGYVTR